MSSELASSPFSPYWYRVKALRPSLRQHAELHRHEYRGDIWYVMHNPANGKQFRFSATAYQLIGLFDGKQTVQTLWDIANARHGDDAPTQDEFIQLLGQLHNSDVLQSDIKPDAEELFKRGEKQRNAQRKARYKNPLALRFPLWDPDRFLEKTQGFVRPLFAPAALLVWLALVVYALLQAGANWADVRYAANLQAYNVNNLLVLALCYPLVKLLHEFGHAYTAKLEGGEVHEMGVMLLVLMPIPYVDASASTTFRSKYRRMLVSAAGIMVELGLAAIALLVWLQMQPGLAKDIAFNIVLIGSVSTVLFNGNPLLRYDAYYVLADAIAIPNLAARSNKYIAYLIQRYAYGLKGARSPVQAEGERPWLFSYSIASFCYRMFLMLVIAVYLINTFFIVGIVLAVWSLSNQIFLPLFKMGKFLLYSPELRAHRDRAVWLTSGAAMMVAAFLVFVPFTATSQHQGVVWLPDRARIVAESDGFVARLLSEPGARVNVGQALMQLRDPLLQAERDIAAAKLREVEAQYAKERVSNLVAAASLKEKLVAANSELALAQKKLDSLTITSDTDGVFMVPGAVDLPGRFVRQGEQLAYVLEKSDAIVRVVVPQSDAQLLDNGIDSIKARLASDISTSLEASLIRRVPRASNVLPSKAFSSEGGGEFMLRPDANDKLIAMESLLQLEVQLPVQTADTLVGTRVHVLMNHGSETLMQSGYRRLRQLLMRDLNV